MAEQTFRSPNFYEREIDQSQPRPTGPLGTPAGVVSTSLKGPAFIPVTVANFAEFVRRFGNLDPLRYGPYAASQFLAQRNSLTFMRVLGAGANAVLADFNKTTNTGQVKNAGLVVTGTLANNASTIGVTNDTLGRHMGCVQFIASNHTFTTSQLWGFPQFSDNSSFPNATGNMIRGIVLMPSGARLMVTTASLIGGMGSTTPTDYTPLNGSTFKLIISSTMGSQFSQMDGNAGVKVFTASLNPTDPNYFAKLLNTDPDQFVARQNYLLADYAVDAESASPNDVAVLSGSAKTSGAGGDLNMLFRDMYGHFDTRYRAPKTTSFISQPFGKTEYDLFRFEALDDGAGSNQLYKVSIVNIIASTDDSKPYGLFTVQIRDFKDTDTNPNVLETYPNVTLDPTAANYIAAAIGDRKIRFNFDADDPKERRFVVTGKYPNKSQYLRVVVTDQVDRGLTPQKALPFGFRGIETLKTNDALTDQLGSSNVPRLAGVANQSGAATMGLPLTGSIVPPLPFRFKVTQGTITQSGFIGNPGPTEIVNSAFCWGVKFERNNTPLNPNVATEMNNLVPAMTTLVGLRELDALVTGSGADTLNNNKFTLARVALSAVAVGNLTSSAADHMKETAYIRNGTVDPTSYTINDPIIGNRITLATLINLTSSVNFNRFTPYTKFTNLLYGGFDGLNFLDANARRMNDKAVSFDVPGGAEGSYLSPGLAYNMNGIGQANGVVFSYQTAADIMTNPLVSSANVLAFPGIREPYLTDYISRATRNYGMAIYIMDPASYDDQGNRLYDDSTTRPDVQQSSSVFASRAIDNNYVATYFPDITITDAVNSRRVKVPASIAALAAYALNDRVAYPWFAPAGFNRAALDFVTNVAVRLSVADRDILYDARMNPIATFPRQGFVIFGQKTLQIKKSALDRVNVRRMLLEVKRTVVNIASKKVFEQNTPDVWAAFKEEANTYIGLVQAQQGIDAFKVIMDSSNNGPSDIELNRLNGRIVVVPTKTIEYIAIDFVITNSGVAFV